jgi:hypothetical protein
LVLQARPPKEVDREKGSLGPTQTSRDLIREPDRDLNIVVAHELVEDDRAEPTQRENAYDDVAEDAEVVVDVANRAPKATAVGEAQLIAIRLSVSRPPISAATTTETAVMVML